GETSATICRIEFDPMSIAATRRWPGATDPRVFRSRVIGSTPVRCPPTVRFGTAPLAALQPTRRIYPLSRAIAPAAALPNQPERKDGRTDRAPRKRDEHLAASGIAPPIEQPAHRHEGRWI